MTNEEAWRRPLEESTLQSAIETVVMLVEPSSAESPERVAYLTRYLRRQDYTDAEVRYAAQELPKDEHLDAKMRYGKPLTPADFERVIGRVRSLRSLLASGGIPKHRVRDLVEEVDDVEADHFAQCGYDDEGDPLYTMTADARNDMGLTD